MLKSKMRKVIAKNQDEMKVVVNVPSRDGQENLNFGEGISYRLIGMQDSENEK